MATNNTFIVPVPMAPRHPSLVKDHKSPEMIAMVHVHSTTAILNHGYTALLKITRPTQKDTLALNDAIKALGAEAKLVKEAFPILSQVAPTDTMLRSAVFLLSSKGLQQTSIVEEVVVNQLSHLPFIKNLVDRAVEEVDTYVKHGIRCVEVENVAAPYFIGAGNCPWEELIVLYLCTRAIRTKYPQLMIGMHVLSANELEVLPLAIACGAYFVRSEATLFHGIRPEGETHNNSNMARYLYARQVLRNLTATNGEEASSTCPFALELYQESFPQVWSDVKKKHTVFFDELRNIDDWLHNINFMKLEGVIVTGAETGSDVDEESLKRARKAVDGFKVFNEKQFSAVAETLRDNCVNKKKTAEANGSSPSASDDLSLTLYHMPHLPVVTGSGMNFPMYRNYADYCIVGTALKHGAYWENEVSEENVKRVVAEFNAFAGGKQ